LDLEGDEEGTQLVVDELEALIFEDILIVVNGFIKLLTWYWKINSLFLSKDLNPF